MGTVLMVDVLDATEHVLYTQSSLVDGWGYWVTGLPETECTELWLRLSATHPTGATEAQLLPLCDAWPAATMVVEINTRVIYMPLVVRD